MKYFRDKIYLITFILIAALIFLIFPFVFNYRLISGGDYTYLTLTYLQYIFHNSFSSWINTYNFGQNTTALLNYAPYNFIIGISASIFNWNGIIIERIFWWIPFFILAFISHFYFRRLLPINKLGFLSVLIFLFNTYSLMLLGGGQIAGVGLAFVIAPIVLVHFIELINFAAVDEKNLSIKYLFKRSLIASLFFSLQVVFDLRFAYITFLAIGLYAILKLVLTISKKNASRIFSFFFFVFLFPLGVTGLIHAFWLLPTIIFHENPIVDLGAGFNSVQAVKYFSFAKFENTLSLLHPYWPENIFGFVHFMKPEFLVIPILAYSSLLIFNSNVKSQMSNLHLKSKNLSDSGNARMTNTQQAVTILFFCLLGFIGAFLAKGANDPFGGVYIWFFQHIPGFFMFRDPTKFYLLVALSYSVLLPYSLEEISERVSSIKYQVLKDYGKHIVVIVFVIFWLFTIRQAVTGQLTGTFKSQQIPQEYKQLNTFITSQPTYFRTLWLPTKQKFGIYTVDHPAISASDYFQISSPKNLVKKIANTDIEKLLQESSFKYIIVPEYTDGTIYLKERKFDSRQYEFYISSLEKTKILKEVNSFGNNKVFEIAHFKNHFWSPNNYIRLQVREISPTKYEISVNNGIKGQKVVFSEKFDPLWKAKIDNIIESSSNFEKNYNSFILPKDGNYILTVSYQPQVWVDRGIIISSISVILIIALILFL